MALGPRVRRLFGPFERQVAEAYRRAFTDLDDLVRVLKAWVPSGAELLEVGCGEGAVTERLTRAYPAANITAIDVTPSVGRLFSGDASRVRFQVRTVEEVAQERPGAFDLVLLSDVIHHVPPAARAAVLESCRRALAPGGTFVFKDWARRPTPIHLLGLLSDRYLTGDDVHYLSAAELRAMAVSAFGPGSVVGEARVAPWVNNLVLLVRPQSPSKSPGSSG